MQIKKSKKSQAATEFLMTYGWAILVIMIIVGSLYAMGVFSPSVPNSCDIDAPFNCVDVKAEDGNDKVSFAISSNGVDIVTGASVSNNGVGCVGVGSYIAGLQDSDVSQKVIVFQCNALQKGDVAKGTIAIAWTSAGTLGHTATGRFYAKVE
ncbi:MAG TPA: hypothetical protein VJH95_03095 [Candidatus Nanoarchaeia archaeon]|nr:hypothetical protein [Candidatus Nanoarchaeia archaeon]